MTLTIAIPTYNRNATLLENIQHLLPQLTPECCLLILDNCSDMPVAETLQPVLQQFSAANVTIIRNRVNIGATANILRCFELCETPWLWVLADDDIATPQAIATILQQVALYRECLFFNFSSGLWFRDQLTLTRGLHEFTEKLAHDSFWNMLFISAGVYRADAVLPNLRFGYAYEYSQAPQLATLLVTIGEAGQCCLSNAHIVNWHQAPVEQQWSPLNVGLGIMTLFELPLPPDVRRNLAIQMARELPSLHSVFYQLLLMAIKDQHTHNALYLYDQLCYRRYYFQTSLVQRIRTRVRVMLFRLLLSYPRLTYKLLAAYKATKGRSMGDHTLLSRFERL